jgi:hypothetical protein
LLSSDAHSCTRRRHASQCLGTYTWSRENGPLGLGENGERLFDVPGPRVGIGEETEKELEADSAPSVLKLATYSTNSTAASS